MNVLARMLLSDYADSYFATPRSRRLETYCKDGTAAYVQGYFAQ